MVADCVRAWVIAIHIRRGPQDVDCVFGLHPARRAHGKTDLRQTVYAENEEPQPQDFVELGLTK